MKTDNMMLYKDPENRIKRNGKEMTARKLMGIALACFLGASLISTVIYIVTGYITNFCAAFFESVSAFTTTGATVYPYPTYPVYLPSWLKVYRAACQWIGGGATLVFLASMITSMDASNGGFAKAGSAQGAIYRTGIRTVSIGRRLLLTYAILTLTEFLLLLASGCTLLDSACLSFSTISTGGFIPGATIANGITETILVLFMIFTCLNYTLYYHAIKKHFDKFDKNTELNALLGIIIGCSVLISISLLISGTYGVSASVENGVFHTVSALSTTGFAIADTPSWPPFAQALLTILSFVGGSTLSPAGGIKIMRIVVVLRLISKSFTVRIHPKAVVTTKVNGRSIPTDTSSAMAIHFLTHFAFFLGGAFVLSFQATDLLSCFTVSAALLNNVGTTFTGNFEFGTLSPVMLLLLSVLMLAGRLELYAVLLPFSRSRNG